MEIVCLEDEISATCQIFVVCFIMLSQYVYFFRQFSFVYGIILIVNMILDVLFYMCLWPFIL